MKKVFLVILNWNGGKMTLNCLKSLKAIKNDNFSIEVIVIDNGSTDDSIKRIQKAEPMIVILENKDNLGFAEGNNVGIKYALEKGADYICLLNNDTRVKPDFLEELVKEAQSDEKIGLVGGKIYFEKGYEFFKNKYSESERGKVIWYAGGLIDWNNIYASHRGVDEVDTGQYDQTTETEYVNGCLMLGTREVFKKVGLFDKRYYLYFEDADLSLRAKRRGFKVVFCPKAVIWHLNSGSSGSGSSLHDYFITRNRLVFGMKYASLRAKIALVRESLKLLKNGREWQKTGIRDFYFRKYGRGSWGNNSKVKIKNAKFRSKS